MNVVVTTLVVQLPQETTKGVTTNKSANVQYFLKVINTCAYLWNQVL